MADAPGDRPGKLLGLIGLLRAHGGAVEADLQRFYGIALSDLCTGRLTWRRLGVLVSALPRESALGRAQLGEDHEWGLTEQLLAAAVDVLSAANWQRSGGKTRRPKPIPRPGVKDGKTSIGRATRPAAEVKALLNKYKPKEVATDGH